MPQRKIGVLEKRRFAKRKRKAVQALVETNSSSFTPQVTSKKWLLLPRTCILQSVSTEQDVFADIPLSVPTAEVSRIAGENLALGCRDREEIGDDQHFQRRTSVESPSLPDYNPVSMSSVILRKEEEIGD